MIYPALSVGSTSDLEKDVRQDAAIVSRDRQPGRDGSGNAGRRPAAFAKGATFEGASPAVTPTVLRVCLLLRLGRADLAEDLFAAATTWTPEVRGRDLTDYGISYLTMARDWASIVFLRLINAHMKADDAIALDAARRLSAFARSAEPRLEALGFGGSRIASLRSPPRISPSSANSRSCWPTRSVGRRNPRGGRSRRAGAIGRRGWPP